MKRSITRWTTTLATAAVLSLPVVGFANTRQEPAPQPQPAQPAQPQPDPQQPQPQPAEPRQPEPGRPQPTDPQPAQPQPAQPQPQPAQPQPTEPQQPQPSAQPASPTAASATQQTTSPQEHLSQARAAAENIATDSVPSKSRAQLAQLKRHLATLEKAGSSSTGTAAAAPGASGKTNANWGTEVAAIDKIITEMVGGETTGSSTPGATGTSGSSKAAASVSIDDATRSRLMEVRAHITAYAAGMAGATTPKTDTPKSESTAASASPASSAAPASAPQSEPPSAAPAAAPSQDRPATPEPSAAPQAQPAPPAAQPQSPSPDQPTPAAQPPAAAGAQEPGAQPQIDADAARRHLMAARESLSQLTQLPAASQLNGEARTQVAQLISNFNELITTQSNWRASYAKVSSNLTALIGADNTDAEAAGGAPTTSTGATAAPGAVGTTGSATVEIDPAIRAKLVEFRHNLSEFQKASGGAEK